MRIKLAMTMGSIAFMATSPATMAQTPENWPRSKALHGVAENRSIAVQAKSAEAKCLPRHIREDVESVIRKDSNGWALNRLTEGSVRIVGLVGGSYCNGNYDVKATYNYNRNEQGWVIVRVNNWIVQCLEYHDMGGSCRPEFGSGGRNYGGNGDGNTGRTQRMCPGYKGPDGVPVYIPC